MTPSGRRQGAERSRPRTGRRIAAGIVRCRRRLPAGPYRATACLVSSLLVTLRSELVPSKPCEGLPTALRRRLARLEWDVYIEGSLPGGQLACRAASLVVMATS